MIKENNRQTFIRWLVEGTASANSARVTAAIDYAAKTLETALDMLNEYALDVGDADFFIDCEKTDLEECASAFDELTDKFSDYTPCEAISKALEACDKLEHMHFYLRNCQ